MDPVAEPAVPASESLTALVTEVRRQTQGMSTAVREMIAFKDEAGRWRASADERMGKIEGAIKLRGVSLGGLADDKDAQKFVLGRALRAAYLNDWSGAEVEKSILDATKRAMSADVDTKGGYVVPIEIQAAIIEKLRPASVLLQSGATELRGLTGQNVLWPKETGVPTIASYAENGTISFSDGALGYVSWSPKMLAGGVTMSRRLEALAMPAFQPLLLRRLGAELALKLDYLCFKGTGGSNQPLGIANHAGIGSVAIGTNGGELELDHLIDLEGDLEDANALVGKPTFFFHGKIRRKLAKKVDADGRPLFNREVGGANALPVKTLLGYPYYVAQQLPTDLTKAAGTSLAEVFFLNVLDAAIGYWGNLVLEATTEGNSTFEKHQKSVKVVQDFDFHMLRDESASLISDAETV